MGPSNGPPARERWKLFPSLAAAPLGATASEERKHGEKQGNTGKSATKGAGENPRDT